MKILLTGGTGFLGAYIADALLQEGHEVHILARPGRALPPALAGKARLVTGDVVDMPSLEAAVAGMDAVVHAAAMVSFWQHDRDAMMRTNVGGTANVVNSCLDAGIRLVHISSTAAVGHAEQAGEAITEQTKWVREKHTSAYSLSKHKAEMEVQRGVAEGLDAIILNPCVVLGIGDWQAGTPKFFSVVDKGLRFYNQGDISVVAAEDVAKAVCAALARTDIPAGERFLLVAETLPQRALFAVIAASIGKNPPTIGLSPGVSLAVGWLSERVAALTGRRPVVSLETMRSSISHHHYDASKITVRLGLAYTPIEVAIARVAKAYRA